MVSIFNQWQVRLFTVIFLLQLILIWGCSQVDTAVSDPVPNCFDGIMNQDELDVDCGGPCPSCGSSMTANVNGMNWVSSGSVTTQNNSSTIQITGSNANSSISLIYTGPFSTGTFNLSGALYSNTATLTNYTAISGSITFTNWDQTQHLLFGTFNFTAYEVSGSGDSVKVDSGKFSFVPF